MSSLDVLRDEYPGEAAWQRLVAVFRPSWVGQQHKDELRALVGDEDIAIVLTAEMGEAVRDWLDSPCKAFSGKTPANVLKSEPFGAVIVKSLIMRMPR
jgi:hypothetical protein